MTINEYNLDSTGLTNQIKSSMQSLNGSQIILYLRWAGSLLVILSAIGFMMQSHADLLPAYRYWVGLAIVLALCAGGLVCNYVLKELTGARLFFALGAAFLPVQVSQVSAMLYTFVHGTQARQLEYTWLQFADVHPALIAIDIGITAVLLITVSYTSFSMLAKRQVKTLMQAALLGSLGLLLPIRDGYWLPVIITLLFGVLSVIERQFQQDNTMQLAEGVTARALISLPLLILVGRSLLYPISFWLAIVIAAIIATIGIVDAKRYTQSALVIYVGQCLGTLAALSIWPMTVEHFVGISQNLYSLMIPVALVLFALSTQVAYHAKAYRSLGSLLATGLAYAALLDDQAFAPLLALSTGIALVIIGGLKYHEKIPFFLGQLCFLGGILFYCSYVVDAYSNAPWLFSIGLGLVVLMLASILEKKHQSIVKAVGNYLNELKDWR
ncbi:MAG: hypothetical protein HOP23_17205 [Methylococcaceae bacterium]|nr:hypothetical protein [Methylococcaceae bacterium]